MDNFIKLTSANTGREFMINVRSIKTLTMTKDGTLEIGQDESLVYAKESIEEVENLLQRVKYNQIFLALLQSAMNDLCANSGKHFDCASLCSGAISIAHRFMEEIKNAQ